MSEEKVNSSIQRKVIIDTDVGFDDALAIVLALKHQGTQVVAFTTVFGNVDMHQATENARIIRKLYNCEHIPIYPGCQHPMLGRRTPCGWPGHGPNGLGGAEFDQARESAAAEKEHAANALIRILKENPGQIDVVAVGPLTNLAMALKLDPDWVYYPRRVFIMGGSHLGRGNTTFSGEFNFVMDPEAAAVVFDSFHHAINHHNSESPYPIPTPLAVVSWETCERHTLRWTDFDALCTYPTFSAHFLQQIATAYQATTRPKLPHHPPQPQCESSAAPLFAEVSHSLHEIAAKEFSPCDALAMYAYLESTDQHGNLVYNRNGVVTHAIKKHAVVEVEGKFGRGALMIDWYDRTQHSPNTILIEELDVSRYRAFLHQVMSAQ